MATPVRRLRGLVAALLLLAVVRLWCARIDTPRPGPARPRSRRRSWVRTGEGALLALLLVGTVAALHHGTDNATRLRAQPVAVAADLEIADAAGLSEATSCAQVTPYVDDQTVSPLAVSGVLPGDHSTTFLCVRNAGDGAAGLDVQIIDTTDTETGCSDDELALDPDGPGCGTTGELGGDLQVTIEARGVGDAGRCDLSQGAPVTYDGVADSAPAALGPPVGAGQVACYRVDVAYPVSTPTDRVTRNQSDRTEWRFRFGGTQITTPEVSLDKELVDQSPSSATWTLTVDNAGPGALAGPITVLDALPDGLTFVSGGGGGFACTASAGTVTCVREADLGEGASAVIDLVTAIDPDLSGPVVNRASVLAGDGDAADNTDAAVLDLGSAAPPAGDGGGAGGALAITGSNAPGLAAVGGALVGIGVLLATLARRKRRAASASG